MLNIAIGLSLVTYWASFYFPLPGTGLSSTGTALIPLAVLACAFAIWVAILFRTPLMSRSVHNKWLTTILLIGNALAVCTIVFHTYNSLSPHPSLGVEDIMRESLPATIEQLLRVLYPFAKVLVFFGLAASGYNFYKRRRALNSHAA